MLPFSFSLKGFKMIPRRGLKVMQHFGAAQIIELSYGDLDHCGGKSLALSRYIEMLGFFVGEADDHETHYNT